MHGVARIGQRREKEDIYISLPNKRKENQRLDYGRCIKDSNESDYIKEQGLNIDGGERILKTHQIRNM